MTQLPFRKSLTSNISASSCSPFTNTAPFDPRCNGGEISNVGEEHGDLTANAGELYLWRLISRSSTLRILKRVYHEKRNSWASKMENKPQRPMHILIDLWKFRSPNTHQSVPKIFSDKHNNTLQIHKANHKTRSHTQKYQKKSDLSLFHFQLRFVSSTEKQLHHLTTHNKWQTLS